MTAKNKTMSEKIVVKRRDHEMASRIVGTIFIIVGIILVGLGIYSFVTYKAEPELDENLTTPVLRELSDATNDKKIELSGEAEGVDKVRIFLNDVLLETVKTEDGRFEYIWEVEDEGIYTIALDGLKGFPRQRKSKSSETTFLTIDWTAPSPTISLEYPTEVVKKAFLVQGTIDPNTTLFLKRGTQSFSAVSDSDGYIEVVVDLLDEGKNVFGLVLQDEAGNETVPEEKVRITYSPSAHINGDGVQGVADEIPEAAGNLEEAMQEVFGNNLMLYFGLIAMLVMVFTSVVLVKKQKKLA
jgi:hypothetical protein